MFCSKCGSEVSNGATFCGTCGAEMIDASTMPVAAAAGQTAVMPAVDGGYQQGAPAGAYLAGDLGNQGMPPQGEPPKKSKKGKVIAIIIAILVLLGAGAGVAWYLTNQYYQEKLAAEAEESAAASAQADQVTVASSESSSSTEAASASGSTSSAPSASSSSSGGPSDTADASADADAYIGTWTGEMTSTKSYDSYNCYGASGNPMELTIKGNESTGQITADVKVLLHGHAMNEMSSDVDKHDGDKMIELKDLVGTFNRGDFSFTRDVEGDYADGNMLISVTTSDKNGERVLVCEVKRSGRLGSDQIIDTYELHKKKA